LHGFYQCTLPVISLLSSKPTISHREHFSVWLVWYRKSGNFGHGFILAPKYEVPKLNTPKYVTLQKITAKIEHCLNPSDSCFLFAEERGYHKWALAQFILLFNQILMSVYYLHCFSLITDWYASVSELFMV
jgi:hypothetical protein